MGGNAANSRWASIKHHLSEFGMKLIYDWSFSLSALIAYNLLVSLLPMVLCLFAIVSVVFSGNAAIQKSIRDRLVSAFPGAGIADMVDELLRSMSRQAGLVFCFSFVVAVFGGSRLLIALDDVLTLIYRLRERTILKQNIHAIKLLLALIIVLPALVITSSAPALLTHKEGLYQLGSTLSSGIFGFILFELIYYYVPSRKMHWRNTWCGALFGAVGLQITFVLFPLYVHAFMTSYVGQLGVVIVTVLFFYLFGLLLVIGAQINTYFFDHIQPLPLGLGSLLSQTVNQENMILIDEGSPPKDSMTTLTAGFDPTH